MKPITVACVITSLMLFLAGCGSPDQKGMRSTTKLYSGNDLPANEVAVLNIRAPLRLIKQMDEPQDSASALYFLDSSNYKIALKPGTYTRSFYFYLRCSPQIIFGELQDQWSITIGPSSPVTFTLDAGREYAVLYTLKPASEKQSAGWHFKELREIQQMKEQRCKDPKRCNRECTQSQQVKGSDNVKRLISIGMALYLCTPLVIDFTPLVVDITTDEELVRLIKTSDDWLLRFYALDLIKDLNCVDLVSLSTNDPRAEVRHKATRLATSLKTGKRRTHLFHTDGETRPFGSSGPDYYSGD